jgi:glutamate racemase
LKNFGPIGVFDSGIGGLTVARSIKDHFPDQKLIYFGDTTHLPYGEKSADSIRSFSERICQFLLAQGCNVIVVACNSASSSAFDLIREVCNGKARVINVIDPMIRHVHKEYSNKKVGLIGTHRTVDSGEYERKLKDLNSGVQLVSKATPLLVPMIEEGYYQNRISQEIIEGYLSIPEFNDISALILACTHYPLIAKEIKEVSKEKIEILGSPDFISKELLEVSGSISPGERSLEKDHFFVSDFTDSFEHSTFKFFGEEIRLELMDLWS